MRRFALIAAAAAAALLFGFWWLMLDAGAPARAPGQFDIEAWRAEIAAGPADRPAAVAVEVIGSDMAPRWAVEAGNFGPPFEIGYTAFQILYEDGTTLVIGGAVDEAYAKQAAQSERAFFDRAAYGRLADALVEAGQIWITHEHPDHVMAIVRHSEPEAIAPALRLNAPQLSALPVFAPGGVLDPALASVEPTSTDAPRLIAPGVVVAPAPGHSAGSLVFFVKTLEGDEILIIGDIVWAASNLDALKTRPRLLQFVVFDPNENRSAVLRQVRALHDLAAAEPDLIVLPSHDLGLIRRLIDRGALRDGFYMEPEIEPEGDEG